MLFTVTSTNGFYSPLCFYGLEFSWVSEVGDDCQCRLSVTYSIACAHAALLPTNQSALMALISYINCHKNFFKWRRRPIASENVSAQAVAEFLVPDWGDIVDSVIVLLYRTARLHRLSGRYDRQPRSMTTLCRSRLYTPVRD